MRRSFAFCAQDMREKVVWRKGRVVTIHHLALVLMFGAIIERPFFNGILSIIRLRNVTSRYLIETLYKCGQYDLVQHMFESTLRRKSDTVIKVPSSWAKN